MYEENNSNKSSIIDIIQLRTQIEDVDKELGRVQSRLDGRISDFKEDLQKRHQRSQI